MLIKLLFYYVSEMRRVCGLVRVMTNKTRSKKKSIETVSKCDTACNADLYKSNERDHFLSLY